MQSFFDFIANKQCTNIQGIQGVLDCMGGVVWGPIMIVFLLGVGIYLTLGLKAMPWRRLIYGFKMLWAGRKTEKEADSQGEITPFQSLMTALSSTVGTGNIAGVATAITLGGPGAIFWMWITALFGMATKYSESMLAVHFREVDELGNHVGGPMYYIKNGLGKNWQWLAMAFAFFGMLAGFGIGNGVQANTVADAFQENMGVPTWLTGVVIAALAAAVIFGGIKRIGSVAEKIVPLMAVVYIAGAGVILIVNIDQIPAALGVIFHDAFTGTAAVGGFAGASVMYAIQFGIARGIFSNEAGLGSEPIAHAAAKTKNPVRQGIISMLGVFIDTIVICSMTALIIVMSGLWQTGGSTGASLSTAAFNAELPGFGQFIITFSLIFFAFSTILGWSYYGERCAEFIFGVKIIKFFRIAWVAVIYIGATASLEMVWSIADVLNALMAVPNLIALALLSPLIFKLTHEALTKEKQDTSQNTHA